MEAAHYFSPANSNQDAQALVRTLTVKETEVLHLLMQNFSVESASKLLGLDETGFEILRLAIFEKLHVDSLLQALHILEKAGPPKSTGLDWDVAFGSEIHVRYGARVSGSL